MKITRLLLLMFLSGVAMLFFLREIGLGTTPSLFGATAYMGDVLGHYHGFEIVDTTIFSPADSGQFAASTSEMRDITSSNSTRIPGSPTSWTRWRAVMLRSAPRHQGQQRCDSNKTMNSSHVHERHFK